MATGNYAADPTQYSVTEGSPELGKMINWTENGNTATDATRDEAKVVINFRLSILISALCVRASTLLSCTVLWRSDCIQWLLFRTYRTLISTDLKAENCTQSPIWSEFEDSMVWPEQGRLRTDNEKESWRWTRLRIPLPGPSLHVVPEGRADRVAFLRRSCYAGVWKNSTSTQRHRLTTQVATTVWLSRYKCTERRVWGGSRYSSRYID